MSLQLSKRIPQIYPQEEAGVEGRGKAKAPEDGAFAIYLLQFNVFRSASALQAWELPAWEPLAGELTGPLGLLPSAAARARPISRCTRRSPAW